MIIRRQLFIGIALLATLLIGSLQPHRSNDYA